MHWIFMGFRNSNAIWRQIILLHIMEEFDLFKQCHIVEYPGQITNKHVTVVLVLTTNASV